MTTSSSVTPSADPASGTAGVSGSTSANATASIPAVVNATVPGGTDAIVKGAKDAAGKVLDVANQAGGIAGAINGIRT